ncbi:MAG: hypothetical protein HYR56_30430 [Acidobacteria bacterium]|nr:hypothetical protein [Acidobacteriota bacterium]MBI3422949.1 hypothetical protein [Acidobacteriota bacterium]
MTLVYLSLWLTLLCGTAAVYFFLTRETARYRRVIDRRLNEIAQAGAGQGTALHLKPGLPVLQRLVSRLEVLTHLQRFLRQAEMRLVINRFVLVSLSVGLVAGIVALLFSGSGLVALAMTLGGMSTPLVAVLLAVLVR